MKVFILTILLSLSAPCLEDNHTHDQIDSFHRIELAEERMSIKSALCCRISGNIVDVTGSIISYSAAGLATASALNSIPSEIKTFLAISAGACAIVAGVLHNLKPIVHKIAKDKQDRAEEIHSRHSSV